MVAFGCHAHRTSDCCVVCSSRYGGNHGSCEGNLTAVHAWAYRRTDTIEGHTSNKGQASLRTPVWLGWECCWHHHLVSYWVWAGGGGHSDIPWRTSQTQKDFAHQSCATGLFLLRPFQGFTATVYNQVHQEQIVSGEMTLNIVQNPAVQEQVVVQEVPWRCVAHSAQRRLRFASHHTSFDLTGLDLTEYLMRSSPSAVLFHYHRRVWDCSCCHWDTLLHAFDYDTELKSTVWEKICYIVLDFNTVLQEQIVSSAPQVVGSLSPSEEFDALVYNPSLTLYHVILKKRTLHTSHSCSSGTRLLTCPLLCIDRFPWSRRFRRPWRFYTCSSWRRRLRSHSCRSLSKSLRSQRSRWSRALRPPRVWALHLSARWHKRKLERWSRSERLFLQNLHHPYSSQHPSWKLLQLLLSKHNCVNLNAFIPAYSFSLYDSCGSLKWRRVFMWTAVEQLEFCVCQSWGN